MNMRLPFWTCLLAGLAGAAFAPAAVAQAPGGTWVSPSGRVIVSSEACAALARHVPAPDVAYTPGVDAAGRPVAPADLPGAVDLEITEFPIEITEKVRQRFGIPADARLFQGELYLGFVEIRDGEVYFNGQKLSSGEEALVSEACRRRQRP